MPNWCSTTYKCTGRKKDLKKLYETLNRLRLSEKPRVDNGFGVLWLGCVVDALGGNWEDVACRGQIFDFGLNEEKNVLTIVQETAWCEQSDFRGFLEFRFPGMKIYYQEEESGCDIYYTNDDTGCYFPERYILNWYNEDNGDSSYEYYETLEDIIEDMEGFTGEDYKGSKTIRDIEKYLEEWCGRDENADIKFCYVHEFKYSD